MYSQKGLANPTRQSTTGSCYSTSPQCGRISFPKNILQNRISVRMFEGSLWKNYKPLLNPCSSQSDFVVLKESLPESQHRIVRKLKSTFLYPLILTSFRVVKESNTIDECKDFDFVDWVPPESLLRLQETSGHAKALVTW